MARAETVTLLPLNSWAKIMGINLFEFNQIGSGFAVDSTIQCDHVWFQYQWQQDFLSREEIAQAIANAERMVAEQLLFWPAPKAFSEDVAYPRPARREFYGTGRNPRGDRKAIQLKYGNVISGGIYKRDSIDLAVAVTLSDVDGDSINDTFTATVATSVTDTDEIAVYFKSADRLGEPIAEQWRIAPVRVSISGGNATITGHSSLLVKPNLTVSTTAAILDVTDATIYVTEIEVYRLYISNDTSLNEQGLAYWDDPDCTGGNCQNEQNAICLFPARGLHIQGLVAIDYSIGDYCATREPDRVLAKYIAGAALVDGQMEPMLARIVSYLATALLPVGTCACDRSNRIVSYWQEEFLSDNETISPALLDKDMATNPFGIKRGAVYAWQRIEELRQQWAAII